MYQDERLLTEPMTAAPGVFDDLNITPEALALIRRLAHTMSRSHTYRDDAPVLAFRVSRRAVPGLKQPHWRVLLGDDPLPGGNGQHVPLPLDGIPAPVTKPVPDDEPEEDDERTCTCDGCTDETCQGECPQCDDHSCDQCWGPESGYECDDHRCDDHYPDGCPGDDISTCCGQCDTCGRHNFEADSRDEVCDRGHCHECDHVCEDV